MRRSAEKWRDAWDAVEVLIYSSRNSVKPTKKDSRPPSFPSLASPKSLRLSRNHAAIPNPQSLSGLRLVAPNAITTTRWCIEHGGNTAWRKPGTTGRWSGYRE